MERQQPIQPGRHIFNMVALAITKKHREHQGFTRQDETLVFFDLRHWLDHACCSSLDETLLLLVAHTIDENLNFQQL
ncbi:hypothetical protein C7B76_00040 [filamentous cyanobacterium CCP2]|nr:hypothetical protein C7B76_00040 [filamentous cyanobacterium CCP2]